MIVSRLPKTVKKNNKKSKKKQKKERKTHENAIKVLVPKKSTTLSLSAFYFGEQGTSPRKSEATGSIRNDLYERLIVMCAKHT
jgi:predicted CopG family antitoxin